MYHWIKPTVCAIALFSISNTSAVLAEETIVSHGISSFGDLKYPADFKHFDYVNPAAPQGGTISFQGTGASRTFDSLNPFILKGESAQGLGLLYDSLMTGSGDEADSSYVYVAESIEYPEDRSWVIFKMRPEARFADGVPMTAHDVVFSYDIIIEKGHPYFKSIAFKDFETVEALDDHTVKFTFKEGAKTRDLPATAGGLSILPKHYWADRDFGESSLDIPIGSSEFKVNAFEPGRYIEYCKIDDYWLKDHPANVGSGNFDCFRYEYFKDNSVSFEAFKSGAYLFHEEFTSKNWATLYTGEKFPALAKGHVVKESLPDSRPSGTQGIWINTRLDKFKNPKTREALGYLFNFEWSNQALFYGIYERTDSFWENSPMQASGLLEGDELALLEPYRDQLPASVFAEPAFTPPVLKNDKFDRKALRKASKLLDEAGWKLVNGQRVNDKGEVLEVSFIDDSIGFERIINPIIDSMKRAGIKSSFTQIDPAQMQERQKHYDFDVLVGRLTMSLSPGEELARIFGTVGAENPGQSNFSGISHPVVDDLIIKIGGAKTRPEMETAVKALDRVLRSLHIWVPNWYKGSHNVAYWDVFGRPETKPLYSRGVIGTWWFDQAKHDDLKAKGALK
jgi:microcin C transport system substrate-binding protein